MKDSLGQESKVDLLHPERLHLVTRREFITRGAIALAGLSATQIPGLAQVAAMAHEQGQSGREATFRRFGIARKRPGISMEEFHYHWREIHGPLGMAALPKTVKRYVQNHGMARAIAGFKSSPFDGASETWFDTLEDALNVTQSRGFVEVLKRDMPNFIETSTFITLITQEHVVIAGPSIARDAFLVKALLFLKRRPGMSVGDFQEHWLNSNGPLALDVPGLIQYVQCHTVAEAYATSDPAFDGVGEMWWPDFGPFEKSWASREMQDKIKDLYSILDEKTSSAMLAYEVRMLWS